MNDQPPAADEPADRPIAEARRGAAIGGALVGVAVILVLAAVLVFIRSTGTGPAPAPEAAPTAASAPEAPAPATSDGAAPAAVSTPPALATRPTVQPGRSRRLTRLAVTTLIRGHGPKVRTGSLVTVNYVLARYRTGAELDASWDTGQPLPPFRVGSGAVVEGFDRGLVGVPVGSRVRLDVPARMAYGNPAAAGRPSGDLRFIVDVLAAR